MAYNGLKNLIGGFFSLFTWTNLKDGYRSFRGMTYGQLFVSLIRLNIKIALSLLTFLFHVFW
jgi:hypothetical protein